MSGPSALWPGRAESLRVTRRQLPGDASRCVAPVAGRARRRDRGNEPGVAPRLRARRSQGFTGDTRELGRVVPRTPWQRTWQRIGAQNRRDGAQRVAGAHSSPLFSHFLAHSRVSCSPSPLWCVAAPLASASSRLRACWGILHFPRDTPRSTGDMFCRSSVCFKGNDGQHRRLDARRALLASA